MNVMGIIDMGIINTHEVEEAKKAVIKAADAYVTAQPEPGFLAVADLHAAVYALRKAQRPVPTKADYWWGRFGGGAFVPVRVREGLIPGMGLVGVKETGPNNVPPVYSVTHAGWDWLVLPGSEVVSRAVAPGSIE